MTQRTEDDKAAEAAMADNRRARLREWFSDRSIPPAEKSFFSQLKSGKASFGEKVARRLEAQYGMSNGFLDMPPIDSVGNRIRSARTKLGLTQVELANKAGVVQGVIANAEVDIRRKPRELNAIAMALGVDPVWLETGKPNKGVGIPSVVSLHEVTAIAAELESLGMDNQAQTIKRAAALLRRIAESGANKEEQR